MPDDLDLEDRLIAALGDEPDTSDMPPEIAEAEIERWRDQWNATDLEDADYAARRYRRLEAKVAEIDTLAARQKATIDEWATAQKARYENDVAYWHGRLEAFHRAAREADPKHNKTIALPCGAELRSNAGRLSVKIDPDREAEARAWLEENASACISYPDPVIVKTEVAKHFADLAKSKPEEGEYVAVTPEGEIVPGVMIVRGPVTYVVR